MNLFLLQQYKFINNLYKNNEYLDILMNIDDFFDILNIYAFPNWIDMEVVEVKFLKYFTNIVLKTSQTTPPDPKGGIVLSKYDCIVKYKETTEHIPYPQNDMEHTELDPRTNKRKQKTKTQRVWLVDMLIPNKHLINDNIYDLETIQQKIKDEDDDTDSENNIIQGSDDMGGML